MLIQGGIQPQRTHKEQGNTDSNSPYRTHMLHNTGTCFLAACVAKVGRHFTSAGVVVTKMSCLCVPMMMTAQCFHDDGCSVQYVQDINHRAENMTSLDELQHSSMACSSLIVCLSSWWSSSQHAHGNSYSQGWCSVSMMMTLCRNQPYPWPVAEWSPTARDNALMLTASSWKTSTCRNGKNIIYNSLGSFISGPFIFLIFMSLDYR